jgi:hypothetical protein
MPATKRAWQDLVEREGWLSRTDKFRLRKGHGGGLEYHVDLLPAAALATLAARSIGEVALSAAAIAPRADQLTLPAIESRDARLALVAAADRFARQGSLTRNTADRAFCALYNLEKIEVEPWVRQSVRRLAPRSLKRWRALRKDDAISSLGVDRGPSLADLSDDVRPMPSPLRFTPMHQVSPRRPVAAIRRRIPTYVDLWRLFATICKAQTLFGGKFPPPVGCCVSVPSFALYLRSRLEEAIGGRAGAAAFERKSVSFFKRKTLQSWIDGISAPDLTDLDALARIVGKDISWFLPPSAPQQVFDAVLVPVVDAEAFAGYGKFPDEALAVSSFSFPREFILRLGGEPARASCLRAVGDSMMPTIRPGALLMIDRSKRSFPESSAKKSSEARPGDDIFVFFQSEALRVKRLRWINNRFMTAISDNLDYPPEVFEASGPDHVNAVGRVIWWDNRL